MDEPVELSKVIITRIMHPSGELGFTLDTPEAFSYVETLGLLEAAKLQLFRQWSEVYGG
jgi:hypothetical protein